MICLTAKIAVFACIFCFLDTPFWPKQEQKGKQTRVWQKQACLFLRRLTIFVIRSTMNTTILNGTTCFPFFVSHQVLLRKFNVLVATERSDLNLQKHITVYKWKVKIASALMRKEFDNLSKTKIFCYIIFNGYSTLLKIQQALHKYVLRTFDSKIWVKKKLLWNHTKVTSGLGRLKFKIPFPGTINSLLSQIFEVISKQSLVLGTKELLKIFWQVKAAKGQILPIFDSLCSTNIFARSWTRNIVPRYVVHITEDSWQQTLPVKTF